MEVQQGVPPIKTIQMTHVPSKTLILTRGSSLKNPRHKRSQAGNSCSHPSSKRYCKTNNRFHLRNHCRRMLNQLTAFRSKITRVSLPTNTFRPGTSTQLPLRTSITTCVRTSTKNTVSKWLNLILKSFFIFTESTMRVFNSYL